MTEITLYANDKRLVTDAGALLPTNARPVIRWREQATFTLRLADGGEFPEGAYHYAFDIDRDFLETEPCNTGECEIVGGALVFTATFDSVRQAQATNNRRYPVAFYMQVTRDGHDYAEYVVEDAIWVDGCVWDGRIPPAPEAPNYYTKAEVDEIAEGKLDKPEEAGEEGNVLKLGEDGKPIWGEGGGGGSAQQATDAEIDARESTTHTITPSNLDYAVRSVLPNVTTIPSATTSYSLLDASATTNNHSWQYFHAPEAATAYAFPAVTNTAVAHRIKLTIDFTDTQTYSFEDAEGTALTPLFTPTISAGDVYEFECEYSAVKAQWLIWPHKQGSVSDDYVMQSQVGAANGVAGLDANGKVTSDAIPIAQNNVVGGGKTGAAIGTDGNGVFFLVDPTDIQILNRQRGRGVSLDNLNKCVTAALTDAKKISLTDAQKASAQDTLGIWSPPVPVIPAATTQYTLVEGMQSHVPSSASTYTLPAVTDNARTHECVLTVRFSSSVLTYAFEDSEGNPLTPLPLAGTIQDGSVVAFRCTWEALLNGWVIMPVMLGSVAPSVQQTLTVSGTGATSNSLDGTYTLTNDTNNSRPVWYNSTRQKYIFAVENGMDAGWYAWVVGGTVVQQSAGDTMMFYTYCTYDVQGLSNLSETPDQSTTPWYSMGSEVQASEFSVTA